MNSSEWGEAGDRIAQIAANQEVMSEFSSDNDDEFDKFIHKVTKNKIYDPTSELP